MKKNYNELKKIFEKYYSLERIYSSLSWDMQVNMPKQGFFNREKQLTLIDSLADETLCNESGF